jgi:hypothetical protein
MTGPTSRRPLWSNIVGNLCRKQRTNSTTPLLFFEHPNSVVLGFQMLYKAYASLRTIEILHLGAGYFGQLTEDKIYMKVLQVR